MNQKFTVISALAIALIGCNDGSKTPDATAKEGASFYAANGLNDTWPMNTSDHVSDDLLADNLYVIVDGSGSMRSTDCAGLQTRIDVAKEALLQFVSATPQEVNLGLHVFDSQARSERAPLGSARETIARAIHDIEAGGSTPLNYAISDGVDALTAQAERQLGYGRYALIVVTDGDADSPYRLNKVVNDLLRDTPIELHTIGFCIGKSHTLNMPGLVRYQSATSGTQLINTLQSVSAESNAFLDQATQFTGEK